MTWTINFQGSSRWANTERTSSRVITTGGRRAPRGALGEILQLFWGMGGPVNLEPDCLGVIGREINDRMAGVLEAVQGIHTPLDRGA